MAVDELPKQKPVGIPAERLPVHSCTCSSTMDVINSFDAFAVQLRCQGCGSNESMKTQSV
jgi:hypothetical protein